MIDCEMAACVPGEDDWLALALAASHWRHAHLDMPTYSGLCLYN